MRVYCDRSEGEDVFDFSRFVGQRRFRVHDASDDRAVFFCDEVEFGKEVFVGTHESNEVVFETSGNVMVVEGLADQFLDLLVVGLAFFAYGKRLGVFRICRHDALRPCDDHAAELVDGMRSKGFFVATDAEDARFFAPAAVFEGSFEFGARTRIIRALCEAMGLHGEGCILEKLFCRIVARIGVLHRVECAKMAGSMIEACCPDRSGLSRFVFRRRLDDVQKRSVQCFRVIDELDQFVTRPCGKG